MLAQTQIAPVKSAILIIYDWFNYLIINYLLSDAKFAKNVAEHFVGGDLAGDFTQIVEAFAQVLRQKIAWYSAI